MCSKLNIRKKTKEKQIDAGSSYEILPENDSPLYCIRFAQQISAEVYNCSTVFSVKPEDFDEHEVSGCFGKKKKMNWYGKRLIKDYNVTPDECREPGIDMKLAFKHTVNKTGNNAIDKFCFYGFSVLPETPEMRKWQQETIDHGVPENIHVKYLNIDIPYGFNPRVHERLTYDHLHFRQEYTKEGRIYQTLNEKMLKAKLLGLSCFISNPEVLSEFQGWGLIVDYAADNKVDSSFVKDVIDNWIDGKPVRRLTGLCDRELRFIKDEERDSHKSVISEEEEEEIVRKLTDASREIYTNHAVKTYQSSSRIRFVRKADGAQCEVFISRENSYTIGIGFLQPPDERIAQFVNGWGYILL